MSATEAAYLAGIVDGEGHIGIYGRSDSITIRIGVSNTNQVLLEWIITATGIGQVYKGRRASNVARQAYDWHTNSDPAAGILQQLVPYLQIKKQQAELAIAAQERLRDPALKADRAWQAEWRKHMNELNRRGPPIDVLTLTAGS